MATAAGVIAAEIDLTARLDDQTAAGAQTAARNLDDLQDRANAAADSIGKASDSMGKMGAMGAETTSVLSKGMDVSVTQWARMTSSIDLASKTLLQFQREQERLTQMKAQASTAVAGGLSQEDVDRSIAAQSARVDGLEKEYEAARNTQKAVNDLTSAHALSTSVSKLSGYQLGILADRAHKFADQVAAGGGVLKAAFYQVPNMVTEMGGLGSALEIVTGAMTGPLGIGVAAAAAGASIYALGSHAEEEQSRLLKLGQTFRATRDDAAAMAATVTSAAEALSKTSGWDDATARSAASTIGGTYNFRGTSSDISALSNIARDAGSVFGSFEDGLNAVQKAMVDPTAEIKALYSQHLPGVDEALVSQVQHLQVAGRQGDAYALVMGRIESATKGAYEGGLTPFQRAVDDLEHAASPVTSALSNLASAMGTDLLKAITSVLSLIPRSGSTAATDGLMGSSVLDNYAGGNHHYGIGQVDPRYSSGYDITTAQGNVDAAITIFSQALAKAGGNLENAAAYYSGNAVGSAGQASYVSAVHEFGQTRSLPSDTSALVNSEIGKLASGWDFATKTFFANMLGHESGGYQYADHGNAASVTAAHPTSASVIDDARSMSSGSGDLAGGYSAGSVTQDRAQLQAQLEGLEKLRDAQQAGSEQWKIYSEQVDNTRKDLANALTPQEKITRDLQDGLDPLKAQTGFWRSMAEVQAQFSHEARGTSVDQTALAKALSAEQTLLAKSYDDGTTAILRQTRAQDAIAQSMGSSQASLQHAIDYQQAYTEAQNDFDETSPEFAAAVAKRTKALDDNWTAQQKVADQQKNWGLEDNLSLIQAETASIGQNADQRQVMISVMQAELEMHRKYGDVLPQEAQDYIALTQRVSSASVEYQHQQEVLSDVTGSISSMADTISDDLTQAFVQGAGSGVSFKTALQGVETQIVSMIAKMALINPLLNSIDGQSRTTLSDVMHLFSSSSDFGGSWDSASDPNPFGGGGDSVSSGDFGGSWSASSEADPFSGSGLSVGQALNVRNSASSGSSGASWLGSALGTKVIGGTSVGNILGGLGGGMAIGGVVNNLTGGGEAGTIGSAIGSALGTGIGSIFGPVGSMIGGSVLGGIGDLIGGLFAKKHYVYDTVSGDDGSLSISNTRTKHASDDVTAGLQADLDSINATLGYSGISVSDGDFGDVGHYHKGKKRRSTSLEDILPDVQLTSGDDMLNQALKALMPTSFSSVSDYTSNIQSIKSLTDTLESMGVAVSKFDDSSHVTVDHFTGYTGDMATAVATLNGQTFSVDDLQSKFQAIEDFVQNTMPSLMDVTNAGAESVMQQVDDLKQKYADASKTAAQYGLDAQALIDKGNAVAASMIAAQQTSLSQNDQSVQARYLAATGNQEGADLANFDVSADQQRQQLESSWQSYLGDTYASNVTFQSQMKDLDKTLSAERLEIQQQYSDKALEQQQQYASQVTSVFSSLTSYASGLAVSDASPLSVQDRYSYANDNLNADYHAAIGGDYDALSRIQSDMQSFLTESQAWNGSGAAYGGDYSTVLDMLKNLGSMDADKVTASLIQKLSAQQVSATGALGDQLAALTDAVNAIQSQVKLQQLQSATR